MGIPGRRAAQAVDRSRRALSQDETRRTGSAAKAHVRRGEAYPSRAQASAGEVSDVAEAASPQATGSDYRMAALPAGVAAAAATTGSPPRALAHGPGGTARGPGGAICGSDSHQVKGAVPASLARRVMSLAYE